jgi:DNA-binding XRE family transcriptional regulator
MGRLHHAIQKLPLQGVGGYAFFFTLRKFTNTKQMEQDILIQISNRIKERRREKNITVQELAIRANVSKGLISQIENSRTIPSLIVLIDIIKALEIDMNDFFKDIRSKSNYYPVLIRRKASMSILKRSTH